MYDVTSANSFEHIESLWHPELAKYCSERTKLLLISNKTDLGRRAVSADAGKVRVRSIAHELHVLCFSSTLHSPALHLMQLQRNSLRERCLFLTVRAHASDVSGCASQEYLSVTVTVRESALCEHRTEVQCATVV